MMFLYIFYISISIAIGLTFIYFFQLYDLYEKEPAHTLVFTAALGGGAAIGISILIYIGIGSVIDLNVLQSWLPLVTVGPIEEGAKLAAMFLVYPIFKKEMNEPTDGVIYMSCIALGFSVFENYHYAMASPNPGNVLALRIIMATPAHILFSLFMGLAFYGLKKKISGGSLLFFIFIIAALVHGIWDVTASWESLYALILLLGILQLSFWGALYSLEYTHATSPFFQTLSELITKSEPVDSSTVIKCPNCFHEGAKSTYQLYQKIQLWQCPQCSMFITADFGLVQIYKYFGAQLVRPDRYTKHHRRKEFRIIPEQENRSVVVTGKLAHFDLTEFNNELERIRLEKIQRFEQHWLVRHHLVYRSEIQEDSEDGRET